MAYLLEEACGPSLAAECEPRRVQMMAGSRGVAVGRVSELVILSSCSCALLQTHCSAADLALSESATVTGDALRRKMQHRRQNDLESRVAE